MDSNKREELLKDGRTDSSSNPQNTNDEPTDTSNSDFLNSLLCSPICSVDEGNDDCGDNCSQENEQNISSANQEQPDETFIDADWIKYSISSWYSNFKHVMPQTQLIELPKDIVNLFRNEPDIRDNTQNPILKVFCRMLDSTIQQVGGTAFIKNNWHAPKDAAMFSLNNLLKVTSCREAITYLSCSNLIMRDFDRELGTTSFYFSIRPWIDIHPATEFRCIVVHKNLIGITPRDWPKYYDHFKGTSQAIIDAIKSFYEENIRLKFPENNYIFDVQMPSFSNCLLWDFSPLNESTKLYAYSWREIKNIIEEPEQKRSVVFRYLEEDTGILPFNTSYEYHDAQ